MNENKQILRCHIPNGVNLGVLDGRDCHCSGSYFASPDGVEYARIIVTPPKWFPIKDKIAYSPTFLAMFHNIQVCDNCPALKLWSARKS